MTTLVTGGSGHLGRLLVADFVRAGHAVRVMSSRPRRIESESTDAWVHGDLMTGAGVAAAVAGAEAIVHLASDPRQARRVDVEGTRLLLEHARSSGVSHVVLVSITGIDRPGMREFGYYRCKLEAEELVRTSGVPYSILRATQFHCFLDLLLRQLARVPLVLPLPRGFRFQPVDEGEVAARLARCIGDGPGGRLGDLVGPEVLDVETLGRLWAEARGVTRPRIRIPVPGPVARAFRAGSNTNPHADHGAVTWQEWLDRHAPVPGAVSTPSGTAGSPTR
ncbi:epimerase [Luteitalea sp. TBR-22]|uniref:SDR family oxidoreductase n=1 Tax=Luteitalea sp. TBR-22 TaxID=2802971 RepID=UPI001AF18AE9|nr:NAD(P)H-binding protein [Luteitalea sp. TBR-22]BCS35997.1 epimerase [Luteitalea sp. TBR-22]